MSKKSRIKSDYSPEFREQAARLVLEEKMSPAAAAKDLGIPVTSLTSWVKKFKNGSWHLDGRTRGEGGSPSGPVPKTNKLPSSSQRQHNLLQQLEASNRELEIKLRRMTQERDILKKAMAYCLDVPK